MWQLVELIPPTTIFIDENVMNVASSYVLVRNEDIILVDPGADIIYPLLRMKLSRLGIKKDEIKYIVLTHMHSDHFFNTVYFPEAKIVLGKKCIEFWWRSLKKAFREDTAKRYYDLIFAGREIIYIGPRGNDLFGGIEIISTNLHQPGHLILIVDTQRGKEAVTGDALLLPYWDAYRLLAREISVKNKELEAMLRYPIKRVNIIHQSHMPPIYVQELVEYISQTRKE